MGTLVDDQTWWPRSVYSTLDRSSARIDDMATNFANEHGMADVKGDSK